jgi:hypothetical protein
VPAQLDLELRRPLPALAASAERDGLRPLLRRALQEQATQAVGAVVARTRGRCAREHHRVADYYRQLIQDAQRPRRKVDPATLQARVEHLRAERDGRLADLAHRNGMRLSLRPAALLHVQVRAVTVSLRLKRRKGEREQRLTLWPGARAFDQLPCAGCERWIGGAPLLCDDQLHALCEVCAPSDIGRPDCPACRSPR